MYLQIKHLSFVACFGLMILFTIPSSRYPRIQQNIQHDEVREAVKKYQGTLDVLFPRDEGNLKETDYRIVLRFHPSFSAESQIVMSKMTGGSIQIVSYTLPGQKSSVGDLLQELEIRGINSPDEIARRFQVVRKDVTLNPQVVDDLIRRYSALRINPALDYSASLDPSMYELWYDSVFNKLHVSVMGPSFEKAPRADALFSWMNDVRLAVEKSR